MLYYLRPPPELRPPPLLPPEDLLLPPPPDETEDEDEDELLLGLLYVGDEVELLRVGVEVDLFTDCLGALYVPVLLLRDGVVDIPLL